MSNEDLERLLPYLPKAENKKKPKGVRAAVSNWNKEEEKKYAISKSKSANLGFRTLDTAQRVIGAAISTAEGLAGTIGSLTEIGHTGDVVFDPVKRRYVRKKLEGGFSGSVKRAGAPAAGGMKTALKQLKGKSMLASERWDSMADESNKIAPGSVPHFFKNKTARVVYDIADPLGNTAFGYALKPAQVALKTAAKLPGIAPALQMTVKPVTAIKAATIGKASRYLTENWAKALENHPSINMAITKGTRKVADLNYQASLQARALIARTSKGEIRYVDAMFGNSETIETNLIKKYESLIAKGDTKNADRIKEVIQSRIPRTKKNFDSFMENYRYTKALSPKDRILANKLAYSYRTGEWYGEETLKLPDYLQKHSDNLNGMITKSNELRSQLNSDLSKRGKKAVKNKLKLLKSQIEEAELFMQSETDKFTSLVEQVAPNARISQNTIVGDMTLVGGRGAASSLDNIAKAPKEAGTFLDEITSDAFLDKALKGEIDVVVPPAITDRFDLTYNWHKFDKKTQNAVSTAYARAEELGLFSGVLHPADEDNLRLTILSIPDLMQTRKSLSVDIPELLKITKNGTPDEVLAAYIKAKEIGLIDDYARIAKIDNRTIVTKAKEELSKPTNSRIKPILEPILDDALENAGDIDAAFKTRIRKTIADYNKTVTAKNKISRPEVKVFTDSLRERANLDAIGDVFNPKMSEQDYIQRMVKAYAYADDLLESEMAAGRNVNPAKIKELNHTKTLVEQVAEKKNISLKYIKDMAREASKTDDAFGRFAVDMGLIDSATYQSNKGWHLRKGYELYEAKDVDDLVKNKIAGLNAEGNIEQAVELEEAYTNFLAWKTNAREWSDYKTWRELSSKNASGEIEVKATRGGISTGFMKQRKSTSKELDELLGVYDDIGNAMRLNEVAQPRTKATSLHYAALIKMGVATDTNVTGEMVLCSGKSWGALDGKYLDNWLKTRLEYISKSHETDMAPLKTYQTLCSFLKQLLITSIPTTVRNVASNAIAIALATESKIANVDLYQAMVSTSRATKSVIGAMRGKEDRLYRLFSEYSGSLDSSVSRADELVLNAGVIDVGSAPKAVGAISKIGHILSSAYSSAEKISKLSVFDMLTQTNPKTGVQYFSNQKAVLAAEKILIDYGDVPPILDMVRRNSPLFLTYPIKMAGNLIKWGVENPAPHLRMYNRIDSFNKSMNKNYREEIAVMPDFRQSQLMLQIGGKQGKPVMLDLTYYMPHSIFKVDGVKSTDPILVKAAAVFMNTFGMNMEQLVQLAKNEDDYGNILIDPGSGLADQAISTFSYIASNIPSIRHTRASVFGNKAIGREQKQAMWYPMLGVRAFDIDEEAMVTYKQLHGALRREQRTINSLIKSISNKEGLTKNMQLLDLRLRGAQKRANALSDQLDDHAKKCMTVQGLKNSAAHLGVSKDDMDAYIQSIVNYDNDPDKHSNYQRAIDAIANGNIMDAVNPQLLSGMQDNISGFAPATPATRAMLNQKLDTPALNTANKAISSGGYQDFQTRK